MPNPSMRELKEGFPTTVDFADFPNVNFKEREVTPLKYSGGGGKVTSTMRNTEWETQAPKVLKKADEIHLVVVYDEAVAGDIASMLNHNQLITTTYPTGATLGVWGFLDEWSPSAIKIGDQPTATAKFVITCENNAGEEIGPVFTPAP